MATSRAQRIGIWVIAAFMLVGTIGSFLIIILANKNSRADQERLAELTAQYETASKEYKDKVDAQTKQLSDKYFKQVSEYSSRAAKFTAADVKELKKEDIVVGKEGDALTEDSSFSAYYIGWGPDGKIFDSSLSDDKTLKAPIAVSPGGVIEGWTKGVAGMKIGGVRELTIPADLAYGETGQGEDIPPNTPLKFIVMVIPTPETVPPAPIPPELLRYYQNGGF